MKTYIEEIQWSWDHPVVQELLLKYYREWLFSTPEKANEIIQEVLALSSIEPPASVLDLGCGLGYHAASFAKLGFNVLAFDPGDRYVAIARENAKRLGLQIEIRQMNCDNLEANKLYDLAWAGAYCPGKLSPSDLIDDFKRIYSALKPDRWFISTVAGKARLPSSKKVRNWEEKEDALCWMKNGPTNTIVMRIHGLYIQLKIKLSKLLK